MFPLVREIEWTSPEIVFGQFANQFGSVFLDSALSQSGLGEYSFIALDPFEVVQCQSDIGNMGENKKLPGSPSSPNPFDALENIIAEYPQDLLPNLPPFQGGLAGFLGYSLGRFCEQLPKHRVDDMQFPRLYMGVYDLVIAFEHKTQKAWVFSSGYPEKLEKKRLVRAQKRMDWLLERVEHKTFLRLPEVPPIYSKEDVQSNFTKANYLKAIQKTIDYIYAGDIFEANISQRFKGRLPEGLAPYALYRRLRQKNPGAFAAYINSPNGIIASVSPERFLRLSQDQVETRPIKGTIHRGKTTEEDKKLAEQLLASEKDWAENVMIVDLMRNDISRVCLPNTVKVPQLCGLESFATVHHLVSIVKGQLKPEYNAIDLLRASFPGGSITGAPKIRCMEIIAEIEETERGPYCGSVGYIGFNGEMDTSIIIRTYCIKGDIVTFQAGGAIVADSSPLAEYEETLAKARALRGCLTSASAHSLRV